VTNRNILIGAVAVLAILWFVEDSKPGNYDEFAQCLTEANATFYGTYWCSHCSAQKEDFGKSMQYVNYVECSLPNGAGQTQECTDAGIRGYPTWILNGGTNMPGRLSFEQLSTLTGCPLPA
jgi:hypothetical protein